MLPKVRTWQFGAWLAGVVIVVGTHILFYNFPNQNAAAVRGHSVLNLVAISLIIGANVL